MELIRIKDKKSIPPFDREILNESLHKEKIGNVWGDENSLQEYLALGMSKGSVFLLHVRKLNQLYCRFTVHRESVTYIRYLPESDTFISSSKQNDICIWKVDPEERNIKVLNHFMMNRSVDFFILLENSFNWF
jgi:WD40 repeat protein